MTEVPLVAEDKTLLLGETRSSYSSARLPLILYSRIFSRDQRKP